MLKDRKQSDMDFFKNFKQSSRTPRIGERVRKGKGFLWFHREAAIGKNDSYSSG